MEKYVLILLLALFSFTQVGSKTNESVICSTIDLVENKYALEFKQKQYDDSVRNKLTIFKSKMAELETGNLKNAYTVVNRYGYSGKYQFGQSTLKGLVKKGDLKVSLDSIKIEVFTSSPELQEKAMDALITHNTRVLKNYNLSRFIGKRINGVEITLEGMLAAAHLRGPNAVRLFVESGGKINKVDGNGTSVYDYIKQFENV
jgi:hypothetical protein